jgi:hypothetical protein
VRANSEKRQLAVYASIFKTVDKKGRKNALPPVDFFPKNIKKFPVYDSLRG